MVVIDYGGVLVRKRKDQPHVSQRENEVSWQLAFAK